MSQAEHLQSDSPSLSLRIDESLSILDEAFDKYGYDTSLAVSNHQY